VDAVATLRPDGTFHAWNASAARLMELAGADPALTGVLDLLPASRQAGARRALMEAGDGRRIGPFHLVLPPASPSGEALHLAIVLGPAAATGPGGRAVSITARDITRSRRLLREHAALRAELVRARRSAVLGRLVETVAHDLGNVLTAIHGYAAIVASDLSGAALDDQLELIRAADRGSELTRSLLARTRERPTGHPEVAVDDIIGGCARMLRRLLPPGVELVLRLASDAKVAIDPMELDQVLMNLVLNARDAIIGTGQITVETVRLDGPDDWPATASRVPRAPGVLLCVTDTGRGMDTATRDRIYEPYFTTKAYTAGTGLGLATVRAIVDRAGGSIEVQTAPDAGASFRIRLATVG
jgi:signal transduction histidine kinase